MARAMPRARSLSRLMNRTTPPATRTDHSHFTSKARIWATTVEPTSAPSIMASAVDRAIRPRPANEPTISAVAVLDCRRLVTANPLKKAEAVLCDDSATKRRSSEPSARTTPVRTMRTPHTSSATLPIN